MVTATACIPHTHACDESACAHSYARVRMRFPQGAEPEFDRMQKLACWYVILTLRKSAD